MIEKIRSALSFPWAYEFFSDVVGGQERDRVLVQEYIRPKLADRILDIGCGPGTMVSHLPETEYVGVDSSAAYIDQARQRFPQARFICERVSRYTLVEKNYFDIVLALGILHHLDDSEALTLFQIAYNALKPGGKLVTIDGVWTADQSYAARYLLSRDRGHFVRSRQGYLAIASKVFAKIESSIRHDLLRIPYTLMILGCVR